MADDEETTVDLGDTAAAVRDERDEEQADAPASEDAPRPKKSTGKKGRRPSVPSWDEIMFGGERRE